MFLLICLIVIFISIPPYRRLEGIILKNIEINKIFENWLIVKNETVKYVMSEDNIKKPYDLISSVSNYEIAMEKILDEKIFNQIGRDHPIYKEISEMISIWQNIQFKLIKSIFYNNNMDIFANEIFKFITETDDFEISMKNTIYLFNLYLNEKVRFNWILFIASICLTIFFILILRNLSYSYLKILEKEKEIRKLSKSIMEIKDKERIRIAVDFHDIIVQNLLVIKRYCNEFLSDNKYESNTIKQFEKIKTVTEKNIEKVREISFNLRPPELTNSLYESIVTFTSEISFKTGIKIDFYYLGFDNYSIDQNIEIVIYRLVCEAVNNVANHAHASKIVIRIILFFPNIIVKIEDNGIGFIYNGKLRIKEHMGIQGMEDRVKLVDGTMEIKSGKEIGTTITFRIPCKGLIKECKSTMF